MKKNPALTVIKWILIILLIAVTVFVGKYFIQGMLLNDDINGLYADDVMTVPVDVGDVSPVKLEISCGYAVTSLMSNFLSTGEITEKELYEEDSNKISTSSAAGLHDKLSKKLNGYTVQLHENVKSSEILRSMHEQLSQGIPVPFCLISNNTLGGNGNELHYSVVTAMDLNENLITVYNVYGYYERYSVDEFIDAMGFKSSTSIPPQITLGTVFGVFNRNTYYTISKNS